MNEQHKITFLPTDHSRPRTLPAEIVFPAISRLQGYFSWFAFTHLVTYVVNLAKGLEHDRWRLEGEKLAAPYSARACPQITVDTSVKTVIKESADLWPFDWSSFPILVDGTEVVIDFGDWNLIMPEASVHPHWLRFHFHSSYKAYPWLGSFPPASFLDWQYYENRQQEIRAKRDPQTVMTILNNQSINQEYDSRRRRRLMVRETLISEFGTRNDQEKQPPPINPREGVPWHAKAVHGLCYVQVPGSWENTLDRGQLQMMGLGIPTISPVLIDQCCDGLVQPGVHYLMCRQDYMDVPDLVRWCENNRDEAAAIGHNAWMFFQEFCTPIAVWSYIKDRIDNGPRHCRQNVEDDLSPPRLYAP